MKLRTFQTNVVLLLLSVLSISGDEENIISCTTPGKVFVGDNAAVTCIFNQNVESNEQDFYIYKTGEDDNEPVIVAICAWENSLSCDFKHGYNAKVQNHTVILNISSAQLTHAGDYTCTTLPPAPDTTLEQCSLSVQAKTPTDTISIFFNKDRRQTSVTCVFPDNLDASHIILERHDLTRSTKPVQVMRCDTNKETCSSGHQTIIKTKQAGNFKTVGVILPSYAADEGGLYLCKTDAESTSFDMCTLKRDGVDTETEPVEEGLEEVLDLLIVPLYAIFVCLLMLVVLVLIFVIKGCCEYAKRKPSDVQSSGPLLDA